MTKHCNKFHLSLHDSSSLWPHQPTSLHWFNFVHRLPLTAGWQEHAIISRRTVVGVSGPAQDVAVITVKSVTTFVVHTGAVWESDLQRGAYLPILCTTQSCWQRGQRLFCFTQRDMQQLWKEWLHSPHTTEKQKEKTRERGNESLHEHMSNMFIEVQWV